MAYVFPTLLFVLHCALHISQAASYAQHGDLFIPNTVLLVETGVHFLSYYYVYRMYAQGSSCYYSSSSYTMEALLLINVVSWMAAFPLIDNYSPDNTHETLSYFLSAVMGGVCLALILDNDHWVWIYVNVSYVYLFGGVHLAGHYNPFVVNNHFMELLLTSLFKVATMTHIYTLRNLDLYVKID